MGVVYRAFDESTGRTFALKQLRSAAGRAGAALFRREYHTLVLLKHPRIIDVHDYGVDPDGPYYTMELLDGDDLRAVAPLDYRSACRHLRDVASSLALLAAHRLVHRDLTASNVRVTGERRAKLIDFGALSPFGVNDTIVGTPPYVPPEAVRGLSLDQRSDLFALGALAYFLLTRSHAYPAHHLSDLEATWRRRPERPSVRVDRLIEEGKELSPIPKVLDDLVLSLLHLDPAARPQSAAEVIERLEAAAGLEPEGGTLAAESFLLSAALVGRDAELSEARALVAKAVAGSGGVISVRHAPGAGGSRLLTEIGLEARLAGATVLHADGELSRGPYGVVRALGERLVAALPVEAKAATPTELDSSGWIRTHRSERPSRPTQDPMRAPLETRVRVQAALERWFLDVARARPLAILVDDAQEMDEASATFLSLLADHARENALIVVSAVRKGDPVHSAGPIERLERCGSVLDLAPLSESDTRAFVESLFGSVPNVDRLAYWLRDRSEGNPLELTELSHYLVGRHIARYVDGTWILPRELPSDLPARPEEAQERRLGEIGDKALTLASSLSMYRGHLSLDLCLVLAEAQGVDAFAALDELTTAGVLTGYGGGYRFAQKATRERLSARLDMEAQRRVHVMLAEYLLADPDPDLATTLDAGFHLLSGGDERRGAALLRQVGLELVETDELPEAIPALEAAVAVYRKLDRPRNELCGLVHPLAFAGFYAERRLADQYGDEALDLLAQETGLALTVRVRRYVGKYVALVVGLVYALVLHLFNGRGGVRGLSQLISVMGGLIGSLTGAAVVCLDAETAARRAARFEPFEPLGIRHAGAFSYVLAKTLVGVTQDRAWETISALRGLLARMDTRWGIIGFPERMRPLSRGGLLYALGALESFMDEPIALERADELEAVGLRLYDMVACQIRANYHAVHGDAERAREYERRVEVHATRNGSTWQAEVWAPSSRLIAYRRTYDVIGLKRSADELDRLARDIPSLDRYARIARALMRSLRGDNEGAIPGLEAVRAETRPHGFIGWTIVSAGLADLYNKTGQHERAEALCKEVLAGLTEEDRRVVALTLDIELELARSEAGSGRTAPAAERLDALIRKHESNRAPVTLGAIHRARAEVAALAGDEDSARYHRALMDHWFRSTKHPSLIAECERVRSLFEAPSVRPVDDGKEEPATVLERAASLREETSEPANTEVDAVDRPRQEASATSGNPTERDNVVGPRRAGSARTPE